MKLSHKLLITLSASFVISGCLETLFPNIAKATYVLHTILVGTLIFFWCVAHASENIIEKPVGAQLLSGFFPAVGVPYYLFKNFGFKQGGIKLTLGFLWLIFSGLLYLLSTYVLSL